MKQWTIFIITFCISSASSLLHANTTSAVVEHDVEPGDSASISLGEVEVEAQMQSTDARQSVYTPTTKQKQAAQSGTQLLALMAIPQLRVDFINGGVSTSSGASVAIFINKIPATQEDLAGLNTADVKRVEYMEYPADPRFRNAPAVVNFVVAKYEWGGYTKLSPQFNAGSSMSGGLFAYSKFAYKKMIYDCNVRSSYAYSEAMGSDSEAEYRFADFKKTGPLTVNQNDYMKSSSFRQWTESVNLRAVYETDRSQLSNTVYMGLIQTPENEMNYTTDYVPRVYNSGVTLRTNQWSTSAFGWKGDYYSMLSQKLAVIFSGEFNYTLADNKTDRQITDGNIVVNNPTDEKAFNYGGTLGLQTDFGTRKHIATFYVDAKNNLNGVDYPGSQARHLSYRETYVNGVVDYQFNAKKWSANLTAGWIWMWSVVNHTSCHFINQPTIALSASFSPSSQHNISLNSKYTVATPTASEVNPVAMQQSEILYNAGNPDLRKSPNMNVAAYYTWLPSNKLNLTVNGYYSRQWRRIGTTYIPIEEEGLMLGYKLNDGYCETGSTALNISLKLLDSSLIFSAIPRFVVSRVAGSYAKQTVSFFDANISATYLYKKWIFSARYVSPHESLNKVTGAVITDCNIYALSVGWSNGQWNIQANVTNFCNWSNRGDTTVLHTPYFDRKTVSRYGTYHACAGISATWTISYGKKVPQGNENIVSGSTTSAVAR